MFAEGRERKLLEGKTFERDYRGKQAREKKEKYLLASYFKVFPTRFNHSMSMYVCLHLYVCPLYV